ncbi:MAG: hypothetical protein WBQ17_01080 [Rhizomicrobium sp.]
MRAISAGVLCAVLVGTAALADDDTPPPMIVMPASESCAPSPQLSGAIVVPAGDDAKAAIDATAARCMKDSTGAGLYQVFALPTYDKPAIVTVASVPVGHGILFPLITILDATGKVTRQIAPGAAMFRGGDLAAVFRLHPGDTFMVVESDPAHVGQSVSRVQESTHVTPIGIVTATMFAYTAIHTGSDETSTLTYSLNGRVIVSAAAISPSN